MIKHFLTPIFFLLTLASISQVAITVPCEYEKSEKLVMVWPYSNDINTVVAKIIGATDQIAAVEIIYNPANTITDTSQIRDFLINMDINNNDLKFIPGTTNTYWLRQYAPVTVYGVFTDTLVQYLGNPGFTRYNRPSDDSLSVQLANIWDMNFVNYGLEFENTNIQYEGLRYLFVGDRIIDDNIPMDETEISSILNSYFNLSTIYYIPSLNQSGGGALSGIDNYFKLLDFETIAISSIPDTLPDFDNLENIVTEISSINSYFGSKYKIVRIPSPPNANGSYPTTLSEELRSYTNSLIINNLIIVPSFGMPQYDSAAYYLYKKYMPGYIVKLIDASMLTTGFGGIHTITKGIPQPNYLRILHKKVIGLQEYTPNFKISCLVRSGNMVDNLWLYYKINNDTTYTKKEIHMVCPQHFALIENLAPGDTIQYYIEAISSTTQTTYPLSAPEGNYTFWLDVASKKQEVNSENDFNIIPNPSNGNFKIIHDKHFADKVIIRIYNSKGKLMYNQQATINQFVYLELKTGYYTLVVDNNGSISTQKLVILN